MALSDAPWSLFLVFPFGLPRWVQYCPSSAGIREPRGQRGIPVVASWQVTFDGLPRFVNAQTPAWTGLQDPASQNAVCILSGMQTTGSALAGVTVDGCVTHFDSAVGVAVAATSSSGNDWSQFSLSDGGTHPGNAKAVWVEFSVQFNLTVLGRIETFQPTITMGGPDNAYTNLIRVASGTGPALSIYSDTTGVISPYRMIQRIPLGTAQTYAGQRLYQVRWTHNFTGSATWTITSRTAKVIGWEQ